MCDFTALVLALLSPICISIVNGATITSSQLFLLQQLASPTTNTSVLSVAALNSTVVNEDPHFSIGIGYGHENLNKLSMLSNAVESLATIAQRDYSARVSSFHGHEPAADVTIDVTPFGTAVDFSNEVAVKCIYWGMFYIVTQRQFNDAEVDCKWDGVDVAQVQFQGLPTTTCLETLNTNADSNPVNATTTAPLSAVVPMYLFIQGAQTLTIWEVYISVMAALMHVARWPSTDVVEAFTSQATTTPGGPAYFDVHMLFVGTLIRARPPYYEYGNIIEVLRQLPAWMRRQGRFAETSFGVVVDGVHMGSGLLQRGPPESLPASLAWVPQPSASVAVSSKSPKQI